jgi:hypothetical protein
MGKKSRASKDRERVSAAQQWTDLEKGLAVLVAVLAVVAVLSFAFPREKIRYESVDQRVGDVDLVAGGNRSSYSFDRYVSADYQVIVKFTSDASGQVVHFKAWNETSGRTIIAETSTFTFNDRVFLGKGEEGVYTFEWWLTGTTGSNRVHIDVLVEPTAKLIE